MNRILSVAFITAVVSIFTACTTDNKFQHAMTQAIDTSNMDRAISPGNDFFRYVNGGWIASNPIPPEYSQYGAFHVLFDQNQEQLKSLVMEVSGDKDALEGSVSQKIRDFYNSGMDTAQIEQLGSDAIRDKLDAVAAIENSGDIARVTASFHLMGINPLFYFYAAADKKKSTMTIANFYQGGLGLPDVDYYLNEDDRFNQMRLDYLDHVAAMFTLIGESKESAREKAVAVLEVETALARISKSRLERRIPEKNYYKTDLDGLIELSPAFDWAVYFETLGLPDPGDLNLGQKEFIEGISTVMEDHHTDKWKTYLTWHLVHASANYLSSDFVEEHFAFFGKTLSGQEEIKPRWKRVLSATSSGLGEAIGQLYVERHFPAESKERMLTLVENLRKAFAERIRNLDWMTDETKQEALAKLQSITVKIGYPDKWKDYADMQVEPGSYLGNVHNANLFESSRELNKIGKPVDKTEWGMTPQTVNAYYNPTNNEIVFPAGILQPPFFNKDADDAVNYGAIGVVIGHEMTHGFDDQGRKYDKDGNMADWWTEEDASRFEEKTKVLGSQYDHYTMLDSMTVDGALTMGENIADLGGLSIAYDAYRMSLNGNKPDAIDGFSDDQRFFMGYAQVWRQNIREKELMRRLKEDVHSPGEARVNVPVFNLDVFVESFGISPGDKLYIEPDKRARIW